MNAFVKYASCALLCAVLLQSVLAQRKPCNSPDEWETRLFQYNKQKQMSLSGRYSYDNLRERERTIEEYTLGTDKEPLDILYLHRQHVQYTFNLKTKVCTNETINRPWKTFSVPANATFLGESYIGSSALQSSSVLTSLWRKDSVDTQGNNVTYMGQWTYDHCLPIFTFVQDSDGVTQSSYFDISLGISNPDIFIPRPECTQ